MRSTDNLTAFDEMVLSLTKPVCVEILRELPTVCPPRVTRQSVKDLKRAIHRARSVGGQIGEQASNLVWDACRRQREAA